MSGVGWCLAWLVSGVGWCLTSVVSESVDNYVVGTQVDTMAAVALGS